MPLNTLVYHLVFDNQNGMTQNLGLGASTYYFKPLPCLCLGSYEACDKPHSSLTVGGHLLNVLTAMGRCGN